MLTFHQGKNSDIPLIRELTFSIWPQTYSSILTKGQIDYMLEMMYSPASLEKQMLKQHHNFIIVYEEEQPVGFASFSQKENNSKAYRLHKIYVLTTMQGKGTGKKIIDHIIQLIIPKGAQTLELNVNRHNPAKAFYEKLGFKIINTEDIDIGNGYFMNDYVMEKKLR
ncbi:MAG: GNAT family N-acetyltransferase [Bacteroidetes bacterium]|nr:GNAT family N-acetyltransferase [Bacteroidota bacterium]